MELNMLSRQNQLSHLETYLSEVDTEVTMVLQSLQWDRKHLLEQRILVPCQYNTHHRIPPDKVMEHESGCFLKSQGYMENERLLPSPFDPDARALVKLDAENIAEIISNAKESQSLFKSGPGWSGNQPLTLERLQSTYTSDERRAIHSAVVAQVPSCHDLSDLDLLSSKDESKEAKPKSKLEILAELRDMKRRRTKYRVAAKTRNYSDVLRDVINTQMELYTQAQDNLMDRIKKEKVDIEEKVIEDYRRNDNNTAPNQIPKATEVGHSEVSHHYENRKRRHNDTYDAYNSARRSKTQERDRTSPRKFYEYKDKQISYASNSKRKDYKTSYRRENRLKEYSKVNKDRQKYEDNDERRNRRRDKNSDNTGETHFKTDSSVSTKDLKKRKREEISKDPQDLYKKDNNFQMENTIVVKKEVNISEDESDCSKLAKPYNMCEKSFRKYNKDDQRNKKKYIDKNTEYEKGDTYRRQKRRETEKQHTHIKEEIHSSEDDQDERMYISDNYNHSRDSSYRYNRDDKRYSKSYEERSKKDSEHYNYTRRYEESSDRYRKKK